MARLKQGMVQGPGTGTSDSILARVSNGEYILPKAVVDLVGKKSLDKLRQQALAFQPVPKYAMGGEVNDTSLADSYNRATAITQETNKMLQGGTTPVAASTPAAPPANAFAQQQAAYNTARSNADPLDVASGRFDKGFARPSMPAKSPLMGAGAFASRQAAYNTAKSSADTLDVASGRFDKGYQPPRFADGGLVDEEKKPGLVDRFTQFREDNRAATLKANKPNMMGVRPQDNSYEQRNPVQAFKGFVDNRKAAINAQRNPPVEIIPLLPTPTPVAKPNPLAQQFIQAKQNGGFESVAPVNAQSKEAAAFQGQRQSVYNDTQKDVIAAQDQARLQPFNPGAARKMQAAEATNEQARQKVLAGQGPLERVTYNRQGGEASGIREVGARRGLLSGAATDAEAARNIQSRLEQDAAASQVVASMNRGAEAERDTRAAKLGVSRGVLDQMEGRMDSPAVQALQERQNAQKPYEAMEQAQSAYRNEQAAIERMRSGAPRGRPGDRVKREAVYKEADARAAAAENMLNAGLGVGKQRLDAETARQQARANAQAAQLQEEGQNRRAELSARTQLGSTALAQQGQNQRAQMEAQQKAEEKAFDRLGDKWKTARDMFKEDYDKQAFSAFAASPELPQILAGMGYDTEAKRAQFLTNPDENQVNDMVRIYNANKGNTGSWFFGMGKKTPKELGETLKR